MPNSWRSRFSTNRCGQTCLFVTLVLFASGLGPLLSLSHAQSPTISPHAFPSGGGVTTGGRFSIAGTVGQAFASGPLPSTATTQGRAGFWSMALRWINSPPTANPDVLARRPGAAAQILVRQLLHNDRDPDFDTLALVDFDVTTPLGGTVYRDGPWLIYQPHPSTPPAAEDSFSYRITDGITPASGSVRLGPFIPSAAGPPNSLSISVESGPPILVHVRFQGIANRGYLVQAAPDPAGPWTPLASVVAAANGAIDFAEPPPSTARFYRLVEPSP